MFTAIEYIVLIVGVGGTGGNFAKEFARYCSFYRKNCHSIKTVLIDGDRVEETNQERQPFVAEDLQQNKSLILASAINDTFTDADVISYPHYIREAEQLHSLFDSVKSYSEFSTSSKSIPVIIGAVDNHRARQCLHEFYHSRADVIWYDSANEFSVGEIVISAKLNGLEIGRDRSWYYPDLLTDSSPAPFELSCSEENRKNPQHLATNLMAANLMLSAVVSLTGKDTFIPGIIYFDRERYFSRFQAWEAEE